MKEKVQIAKVYNRKKNGVVPVMMKFQNGKLSAFTKENTHFCRLRNREVENQMGALVVAKEHIYQGVINDTESNDLTDTYICVRNKCTNKMTIIPIDQVTLKNTIYQEIDQIKQKDLSDHVSKMTLLKKFGGRKSSRFVNDQEKMRMDIKLVQDELKTTVEDTNAKDVETEETVNNVEYFDKIRPPINKEAESVSEVYKIEDVVPMDLLCRLDEEAKTVYQTQIDLIPINSEYLKKVLGTIQQSPPENKGLLHIKLILYMDALLRLIKSKVKFLKTIELSEISEKVEINVRERFADPNVTTIGYCTSFTKEKALCHFIVLSLLVDKNYQIDGDMLSLELNTSRAKLFKYAHIVQAVPKSRSSILYLKLPKNVPKLPASFSRKKINLNK